MLLKDGFLCSHHEGEFSTSILLSVFKNIEALLISNFKNTKLALLIY